MKRHVSFISYGRNGQLKSLLAAERRPTLLGMAQFVRRYDAQDVASTGVATGRRVLSL